MNNYIICTVQRSGKSWIAETLNMLGLGYGIELLTEFERNCAPEQHRLRAALYSDGMAGLARSFARQRIEAGMPCASITLQWSDFDIISDTRRPGELNSLIEGLDPCIVLFLKRRDVLSQAISHFLMMGSGYYHSTCPEDRKPQRASVCYDRAKIEKYLNYTQRCYAEWTNLFAVAGVVPEIIYYEDFVSDPTQNFAGLADRIAGRSFEPEAITAASAFYSKISDEIDSAFRARYLAGQ